MKNWFRRFFAGMGIGTGAAIPGVSGAAIAVIFHVYEDIINAVNNFRKKFGYSFKVLLPILLGIICAVIPCIIIFHLAFEYLMFALICIFVGFLIGSFPGVTKEVKGVKITGKYWVIIILGILFVIGLGAASVFFGDAIDLNATFDVMPWWMYLVLIPVGVVAAVALTVPGLSGSLILLVLGFYRPLVDHTTSWAKEILTQGDFTHFGPLLGMLGCFAIGCLIGVVLVSKIMRKLLDKAHDATFFAIIGFILGSIVVLFFNYDIVNYYKVWMGTTIENINPILPAWVEIIIGMVLIAGCAFASFKLVKAEDKEKVNEGAE
ncbi:MAG: DUF368 domain-containing protein [Bacilli bacterium]|nr:DUF368 domain-containing protein [Bacilli bacterium]